MHLLVIVVFIHTHLLLIVMSSSTHTPPVNYYVFIHAHMHAHTHTCTHARMPTHLLLNLEVSLLRKDLRPVWLLLNEDVSLSTEWPLTGPPPSPPGLLSWPMPPWNVRRLEMPRGNRVELGDWGMPEDRLDSFLSHVHHDRHVARDTNTNSFYGNGQNYWKLKRLRHAWLKVDLILVS